MRAFLFVGVVLVLLAADGAPGAPLETRLGGARWGASYFPNVPLVTQEGKRVRFFDDLVKDKVVAINFIFTSCGASCPLETARMATVHRLLGDRVGRDVFFYSITIDPEHDTPEVLAAYAERFHTGPGWLFLTGDAADITQLRRKLGVLADETGADGSPDHNLSFVIGNQATGQWMRRSPFENPYVLAEQLGGWLHNWSAPDPDANSYAEAPARIPQKWTPVLRSEYAQFLTRAFSYGKPDSTLPENARAFGRRRCSSSRGMISTKLQGRVR